VPSLTPRRRFPAALAALAIVGAISFAGPALADEIDPILTGPAIVVPAPDETEESTEPTESESTESESTESESTESESTESESTESESTEGEDGESESGDTEPSGTPSLRLASFGAPELLTTTAVAPIACVAIPGWAEEDLPPIVTADGLVFNGPKTQAVNYYQRVSAGNAQGITGMAYTIAAGTTGYKAELKVEVNPNADLGSGVIHYATLSTIGTPSSGTIDAQNALWYTNKIAYSSPGGMGNPLSWDDIIALMPNNTLLSAPSLHLQSNSTADSHSVVTSVTSSCGTTTFPAPVAAVACTAVAGWAPEDVAPALTTGGLVFNGPNAQSVNYYQRVSSGNAQGITGMAYTLAPGTTGYKAELKVEVNPNADLGSGVIHYATLSTIGTAPTGTIDAQNAQWYTNKIAYSSPGGMGNPLSWSALIALMPNNTLLSAPSLHLQSNSTADSHSIVKSVTSSCGTTDFTTPAPVVETCLPSNVVKVAVSSASQLTYDSRSGGSSSITSKGLELAWHGPDLTQSKVAWYYATNFPLYKLGSPSISYDVTSGASVGQNFSITVDGVWKGNIVKEPGIPDYWTTFSIPGMSADPTAGYRKAIGTIQDFVNAYWADSSSHDVRVVAIGGSGGSGSQGVGILHSQSAGCYELTYGIPAVVTPPATTTGSTTGTTGTAGAATPAATPTATPSATPKATPSPTPTATTAPSEDDTELPTEAFDAEPTGGDAPWWPWAVGAAILALLALLWFLVFRRRFANRP
jgi:hypothetical protein